MNKNIKICLIMKIKEGKREGEGRQGDRDTHRDRESESKRECIDI